MASRVDAWDDVVGVRAEKAGTNDMGIEPLIQERDNQAALSGRATVGVEDALVEVDDVTRNFGKTRALQGVSLKIRPGEIHALLGPNGAGKTTLVRMLAGLVAPTSGQVRVAGIDPTRKFGSLRRRGRPHPLRRPLVLPSYLGYREPHVLRPAARATRDERPWREPGKASPRSGWKTQLESAWATTRTGCRSGSPWLGRC